MDDRRSLSEALRRTSDLLNRLLMEDDWHHRNGRAAMPTAVFEEASERYRENLRVLAQHGEAPSPGALSE
jgi:hypothetical protein